MPRSKKAVLGSPWGPVDEMQKAFFATKAADAMEKVRARQRAQKARALGKSLQDWPAFAQRLLP